ncbi:MAG: ATP-binding protein [Chloroflexota bacterium]|nr:ATP-binding protein [Chloroflexota bacterium]
MMAVSLMERDSSSLVAPPGALEETGLDLPFIADLVLKIIYYSNQIMAQAITDEISLPFFNVVDRALTMLKREELIEVVGSQGFGQLAYQYSITSKGNLRVREVLERTTYVGPAPITLEHYTAVARSQINADTRVSPEDMRRVMSDLVLDDSIIDALGQAVNTGRALFLYGPPGNGKTVLAEHIIPLLGTDILIPYAITVDGQVIKVLDLHNHEPIETNGGRVDHDRRFVLCRRPAIIVGGELTLAALDLVYDSISKVYEAPLQLKANGGMMMIDDFGRQQVEPRQLLNRWIVPLEKRVDYLTLHTGKKIQVPFNQMVVFSTNLAPPIWWTMRSSAGSRTRFWSTTPRSRSSARSFGDSATRSASHSIRRACSTCCGSITSIRSVHCDRSNHETSSAPWSVSLAIEASRRPSPQS